MRCVGDNTVGLLQMKFGFAPVRKRGPVFNIRSQGKSFGDGHRCLVPASAFLESAGSKNSKAKYRFELVDAPFMAIAAIWRRGRKSQPSAFAMLTTYPGFDVKPFHNRQVVVLRPSDWKAWLDLERSPAELLQPLLRGALKVEEARPSEFGAGLS
jgi:putative SOS response-associated peptidase YedK